jgi:hypothetical protein
MDKLRKNIDAIRAELEKPEVLATLRMVTPDLYANITAIVAVYDAYNASTDEERYRQWLNATPAIVRNKTWI